MRVTAPDGVVWTVERVWFSRPAWSRRTPEVGDVFDAMSISTGDVDVGGDDPLSCLASLVVGLLLSVVVAIALVLLLPLLLAVVGIAVAAGLLGARLAWLSRWQVRATSATGGLGWNVRGPLRSRRAIHDVARALARGEEPLVGGRRGSSLRGSGPS